MTPRPRRTIGLVVALLVVALLTVACSDSDDSVSSGNNDKNNSASPGPGKESDYVGLSKSAAIAKAKADDRPWRISREDDELFMGTLDFNPDRVSFEIDDGKVTTATFG